MAAALALFPAAVFCDPLQFVRAGGGFVFSRCIGPFIAEEQPELCVVDLLMLAASRLTPLWGTSLRSCPSRSAVFILAHPPVAFAAPRRHVHLVGIRSQC